MNVADVHYSVALEKGREPWDIDFNFHDLEIDRIELLSHQLGKSRHHPLQASSEAKGQILSSIVHRLSLSHYPNAPYQLPKRMSLITSKVSQYICFSLSCCHCAKETQRQRTGAHTQARFLPDELKMHSFFSVCPNIS
jgi:hypothetical protein